MMGLNCLTFVMLGMWAPIMRAPIMPDILYGYACPPACADTCICMPVPGCISACDLYGLACRLDLPATMEGTLHEASPAPSRSASAVPDASSCQPHVCNPHVAVIPADGQQQHLHSSPSALQRALPVSPNADPTALHDSAHPAGSHDNACAFHLSPRPSSGSWPGSPLVPGLPLLPPTPTIRITGLGVPPHAPPAFLAPSKGTRANSGSGSGSSSGFHMQSSGDAGATVHVHAHGKHAKDGIAVEDENDEEDRLDSEGGSDTEGEVSTLSFKLIEAGGYFDMPIRVRGPAFRLLDDVNLWCIGPESSQRHLVHEQHHASCAS